MDSRRCGALLIVDDPLRIEWSLGPIRNHTERHMKCSKKHEATAHTGARCKHTVTASGVESASLELYHCLQLVNSEYGRRPNALRLVRFLYMMRCPHSRQRMGSRALISFFAPQSSKNVRAGSREDKPLLAPAQMYSMSGLGAGM